MLPLRLSRLAALPLVFGMCAAGAELDDILALTLENNPRILAARHVVRQSDARTRELLGFKDIAFFGGIGTAERARGIPGRGAFDSLSGEATVAEAGFEVPVEPGAYIAAGAVQRYIDDPPDGLDRFYQTLVGLSLRVPLQRDRGFEQWDAERDRAAAEHDRALNLLLTEMQAVSYATEVAYVSLRESMADHEVARVATERLKKLLDEARELARLKVVPDYQVAPALMEYQLSLTDEVAAREAMETKKAELERLLAGPELPALNEDPFFLVELTAGADVPRTPDEADVLARRGDFRQIENRIEAARADLEIARNDLKPDTFLNVAATLQGDDPDDIVGHGTYVTDDRPGGEIWLTLRRPLGYTAERSRVKRYEARISELKENLREMRYAIRRDVSVAETEYRLARERLVLLGEALRAGEETLAAEEERFRLGEGRSRNVLDAQRDLTNINRRRTRTAAALLRAQADYRFAVGRNLGR